MSVSAAILGEFERLGSNGFVVYSKGIGLLSVIHEFIAKYGRYNSLSLIINLSKEDSLYFKQNFNNNFQFDLTLHVSEYENPQKRAKSYLKGGVIFTSSQVVTLDLLSGVISADLLNNILVLNASSFDRNSVDFMLRIIKEYSFNHLKPERCLLMSTNLEKLVDKITKVPSSTFTNNIMFWPFYRLEVKKAVEASESVTEIIDCEVEFGKTAIEIQNRLLLLLGAIEKKMAKRFDVNLKKIREHELNSFDEGDKEIIIDYMNLRKLLHYLCECDNLDFYIHYLTIVDSLNAYFYDFIVMETSLLEEIDTLCYNSLFNTVKSKGNKKSNYKDEKLFVTVRASNKHKVLVEALKKVSQEAIELNVSDAPSKILILSNTSVKSENIKNRLFLSYRYPHLNKIITIVKLSELFKRRKFTNIVTRSVLDKDNHNFMVKFIDYVIVAVEKLKKIHFENINELMDVYKEVSEDEDEHPDDVQEDLESKGIQVISEAAEKDEEPPKIGKKVNVSVSSISPELEELIRKRVTITMDNVPINFDDLYETQEDVNLFKYFESEQFKSLVINCASNNYRPTFSSRYELMRAYSPNVVVFYDMDIEFQRELQRIEDIYPLANKKGDSNREVLCPRQIINIFVKNSIQSDRIYEKITNESKNFETLIRTVADTPKELISRQLFTRETGSRGLIIVDKREFTSSLPFELYKSGFNLKPIMLKTADYILTNDVAVERKDCATGDLMNSLKSGRLQKQLKELHQKFGLAILLIENYGKSSYYSNAELFKLIRKLRGVRIVWSSSEVETVRFFEYYKKGKAEPDPNKYNN